MTESDLIRQITDFLNLRRILWWRQNVMGVRVVRNGQEHFYRSGKPGLPDIFVILNGICIGIEAKVGKNDQSRAQAEFQTDFERAGGHYCLARSLEDVEKALKFKKNNELSNGGKDGEIR